jgi:hypothetical protein
MNPQTLRIRRQLFACLLTGLILISQADRAADRNKPRGGGELKNEAYHLAVTIAADGTVNVRLDDLRSGLHVADGPGLYRACGEIHGTAARSDRLEEPVVTGQNRSLVIRGKLLGQELTHTFTLPKDKPLMEERIVLRNPGSTPVALTHLVH